MLALFTALQFALACTTFPPRGIQQRNRSSSSPVSLSSPRVLLPSSPSPLLSSSLVGSVASPLLVVDWVGGSAICREAARVVAPGGWFMIVSHIHPSTTEGMELLSETLVPALQDSSSSVPVAKKGKKKVDDDDEEEEQEEDDSDRQDFFWSVDVHCGGGDEDEDDHGGDQEDSEGESGASGSGGADEEGGGEHSGEDEHDGGDSAGGQVGPSAYMARKVGDFFLLPLSGMCPPFCFWGPDKSWHRCESTPPCFALHVRLGVRAESCSKRSISRNFLVPEFTRPLF